MSELAAWGLGRAAGDLVHADVGREVLIRADGLLARGELAGIEHGGFGHAARVKLQLRLPGGGIAFPELAPDAQVVFP